MKKIILLILSFLLVSCGDNTQNERNSTFLETYNCTENNSTYECEKLGIVFEKDLFKVYNDVYVKDKNALYKIAGNGAEMLDIEIRKLNDIETTFKIDGESFVYVGGSFVKDKNGVYNLYNYKNDPVTKLLEADAETFEKVDNGYKDKNFTFDENGNKM